MTDSGEVSEYLEPPTIPEGMTVATYRRTRSKPQSARPVFAAGLVLNALCAVRAVQYWRAQSRRMKGGRPCN